MNKFELIYTVGSWMVKPGNESSFVKLWGDFAKQTFQDQPAATEVLLLQDLEQPQRFLTVGPGDDFQAVENWRQSAEFKSFFAKVKELCEDIQPITMKPVIQLAKD